MQDAEGKNFEDREQKVKGRMLKADKEKSLFEKGIPEKYLFSGPGWVRTSDQAVMSRLL